MCLSKCVCLQCQPRWRPIANQLHKGFYSSVNTDNGARRLSATNENQTLSLGAKRRGYRPFRGGGGGGGGKFGRVMRTASRARPEQMQQQNILFRISLGFTMQICSKSEWGSTSTVLKFMLY